MASTPSHKVSVRSSPRQSIPNRTTDQMSSNQENSLKMEESRFSQDVEVELKLELGELLVLAKSLEDPEEEDTMCTETTSKSRAPSLNVEQTYGNPLSQEEAVLAVPSGSDGLKRYALVIPDDFCVNGKLMNGLNPRDFDIEKGAIKPRRATLPLTKSDLMSSLTMVVGDGGPRYIFNGVLNGWPSLRHFELIRLEKKRFLPGGVQAPEYIMNSLGKAWLPHWSAGKGNWTFCRRICSGCQFLMPFVFSISYLNFMSRQEPPPRSTTVKSTGQLCVELLGPLLVGLQEARVLFFGLRRSVHKGLVSCMDLMRFQSWKTTFAKR